MKIAILPVLAVFIAIISLAPQDAHAATYTIAVTGPWTAPSLILPGDIVNIDPLAVVTISGAVTNFGTINNPGEIDITGALSNKAGAIINNLGIIDNFHNLNNFGTIHNNGPGGKITNEVTGNINNLGLIDNNGGKFINKAHINNPTGLIKNTNGGLIDNSGGLINNPVLNSNGVKSEDPCASVIGAGTISPQPVILLECKSVIPEFPIPFSMIIIFVAVAAVYMGIRQKMIPGFKI